MIDRADRSTPTAIGERIATLRKQKELSQAALAKLCGLSQQTIGALESRRVSNPGSLPIIAQFLNVSAEYLRYGRSKGVPVLSSTSRSESFPVDGVDVSPTIKMLQIMPKHSMMAFAFQLEDNALKNLGILANDFIVVDPGVEASPELPVCVRYKDRLTVRLLKSLSANEHIYIADNELYAPLNTSEAELIGTVINITRNLK